MDFSVKQKKVKDGLLLAVSGSLTIEHVDRMRQALMEAFDKKDLVTVDLSAVEEMDLTGLQLFCAAHRTSIGLGKRLVVMGSTQPHVKAAAAISGFYRHVGCVQDVTKTCVWVEG